jgi:hypothetical protein
MILDGFLLFTGNGAGATGTIANGPNTDAPTTGTQAASNIIDLGMAGIPATTTSPAVALGGARDIAIGDDPMLKLLVEVTTSFATGTSIQAQLQGAPDNTTTPGTPGSFTTMWTGPAVLTAAATQGAYLANVDVPRTIPGQPLPRFLQLNFISAGSAMTAGAVVAGIVIDRFDQIIGSATGALSGYVPGVTVPN